MLKRYIDYLKDNPKGYWFKRKLYGWGWAPVRWQGWLAIALFALVIVGIELSFGRKTGLNKKDSIVFFSSLAASIAALLSVCFMKGEKPRWQWGVSRDTDNAFRPGSFFAGKAVIVIIALIMLAYLLIKNFFLALN